MVAERNRDQSGQMENHLDFLHRLFNAVRIPNIAREELDPVTFFLRYVVAQPFELKEL